MVDNFLGVVAGLGSVYGILKDNDMNSAATADQASMLNSLVDKRYSVELAGVQEKARLAQQNFSKFQIAEKNKINELINTDEYRAASNAASAAKAKIDILKKSIKDFEADKTQVAVGSGDSAIAVSVSNVGAKTKLESDLAEAEATYKTNTDLINTLKSQATSKVVGERTDEFYISNQAVKDANAEVAVVKEKMAQYREKLRMDNTEVRSTAIVRNYSRTKIIGVAAAKSALPAWLLYKIWKGAVQDLRALETAKELV